MENDTAADLARWLTDEHARLTSVRFGPRRYVARDVDAFISDLTAGLSHGDLPELSWIRGAKFHTTSDLRGGYRMQTVDELLTKVEERSRALRGESLPTPTPEVAARIARIQNVQFMPVRGGYDFLEVDQFLEHAVDMLAQGFRPDPAPAFPVQRRGYDTKAVDSFLTEMFG